MKLPFQHAAPRRELRRPRPTIFPKMQNSYISALYYAARVGGDFFDFMLADSSRLIFLLLDVAGQREEALDIAAAVQDRFREMAPERFRHEDLNENEALIELLIELNRTIMRAAGGVRCAPAFLGCYDERFGTLTYANAGHIPGILKDEDGLTVLEAGGLPLGLFSHAMHDSCVTLLRPGALLVLVSKGLVELKSGYKEFGLEGVKQCLDGRQFRNAEQACAHVLDTVNALGEGRHEQAENDITTVALVRGVAAAAAIAGG